MINLVLVRPEIPPNTGNAIRLAANTGARLHIVGPAGFARDHARMRRAGLDYHEIARVQWHDDWATFRAFLPCAARLFAITTRGTRSVFEQSFDTDDWVLFGAETRGLPPDVLAAIAPAAHLRIPMQPGNRSLNLSNAVAVVAFEAWRQAGFPMTPEAPGAAPDQAATPAACSRP